MDKRVSVLEELTDFSRITCGGTRTQIKLARPWQESLESIIKPESCPFEKGPKEEEKILIEGIPRGWWLLTNIFTPHLRHRLIIPDKCWPAEKLQKLGGFPEIKTALEIAEKAINSDGNNTEIALFMHVGRFAGQNLGHPHWHLMEARIRQPFEMKPKKMSRERLIKEEGNFFVVAGGARVGECLIVSEEKMEFNSGTIPKLAEIIEGIVELGNKKFLSSDKNLPPDFHVLIRIKGGYFRYADYCPILTFWGVPENVIAPLEGGPYTLPWPHETTAAYLRNE